MKLRPHPIHVVAEKAGVSRTTGYRLAEACPILQARRRHGRRRPDPLVDIFELNTQPWEFSLRLSGL